MKNFADVYEIKAGQYSPNKRNKYDPIIISSAQRNIQLPYSKCNQILDFKRKNIKNTEHVYHKLQILPHIQISTNKDTAYKLQHINANQTIQRKNSASSQLNKSNITVATQKHTGSYYSPNALLYDRNRKISDNSLERNSIDSSPINDKTIINPFDQFQSQRQRGLGISRLTSSQITLGSYKTNKSMIKLQQTPLGCQKQSRFFTQLKRDKSSRTAGNSSYINHNDQIYLPKPVQNSPLKYKRKLITLFELKNSQSSDDLFTANQNQPSDQNSYFNFGKVTQSKIIGQSETKKSTTKIQKLTSLMHNSVVEDEKQQQEHSQNEKLTDKNRTFRINYNQSSSILQGLDSKVYTSNALFNPSFQYLRQQSPQESVQQKSPSKRIIGIKKVNNIKLSTKRVSPQQKKIQTPKFGKIFSFKQQYAIKQKNHPTKQQVNTKFSQTKADFPDKLQKQNKLQISGQDSVFLSFLLILLIKQLNINRVKGCRNV